ncbi:MAG: sel1 repeat family protein [Lachnospiraceae bacterium]|nr:sel1 repeat family protein [Lachnospiraceae bacterium]
MNEQMAEKLNKYGVDPGKTTADIIEDLEKLQADAFREKSDDFERISELLSCMESLADDEEKIRNERPSVDNFDYSSLRRKSGAVIADGEYDDTDPNDVHNNAQSYYNGDGEKKDLKKAFELFLKSAELGNPLAMDDVGLCYLQGEGTEADPDKGFFWIEKAAKLGCVNAMYNLAILYRDGKGVESDSHRAFKWMSNAYNNGHILARNALGVWYYKGVGTEIDTNMAVSIWKENAKLGIEASAAILKNLGISIFENTPVNTPPVTLHLGYTRKANEKDVWGLEITPVTECEILKKGLIIEDPVKDFAIRMKSGGYAHYEEDYIAADAEVVNAISDLWGGRRSEDVYTVLCRALEVIAGLKEKK